MFFLCRIFPAITFRERYDGDAESIVLYSLGFWRPNSQVTINKNLLQPKSYQVCTASEHTQVTLTHLACVKKKLKPKIALSENVVTGNIGMRVVETLSDVMQSKAASFCAKPMQSKG